MRNKRILAMLMTVTLLTGTVGYLGEQTQAAAVEPEVMISGVKVTEDGTETGKATGYLEVSLEVQAENFQTAGVVLSYDTGVLTLVDWKDPAEAPELTENWTTVIPSKGADRFSGKPALGRLEESGEAGTEEGAGARGYLYLGADSLRYQDLSTEAERLVTVRFQIKKDAEGDYLPVNVPGAGESLTNPNKTLCLAPEGVAEEAIPGAQVMLSVGVPEEEVTDGSELNPIEGYVQKYYAWRSTESKYAENDETACKVSFRVGPGKSINTGGEEIVGGGDYAITFFDWDGRAIDAISAPEDATTNVNAWMNHTEVQKRLGNKAGYEFDQWLVVYENNDGEGLHTAGGTFTSNDSALDLTNAIVKADVADLSDISGYTNEKDKDSKSVLLQASYKATADINTGVAGAAAQHYTVKPIAYTRYGGATSDDGKYSITLEVKRLNTADKGVTRARTPGVVVKMQPTAAGAQPIFTLLSLENTDTVTCEMVPNKQVASVEYYFIDANTSPGNWPGAGNLSPLNVKIDKDGNNGFIRLGTVGYINQMAREKATLAEFQSAVDHQTFVDAGLNYSAVGIATAQKRMYNAVRKSTTDLTSAQLQTAIGSSAND